MKRHEMAAIAAFFLGVFGLTVLVMPLRAQKDFNMDEKKLIENYKRANPLYLDGSKQFIKGNLEKAEKKLLEALAIMPEHAEAAYVMAQVHLKRKEFLKALDMITTAKNNFTANSQFHTFTYQEYLDRLRQQREQMVVRRGQVQEIVSGMPVSRGDPYFEKNRLESEVQTLTQSIQAIDSRLNSPIPPTFEIPADYFYIHGNALFKLGRPLEAAAQYREAIRLDPAHGNACNNLALVLFSLGNYKEALDCLAQAEAVGVKINPDFKKAVEAKVTPQ